MTTANLMRVVWSFLTDGAFLKIFLCPVDASFASSRCRGEEMANHEIFNASEVDQWQDEEQKLLQTIKMFFKYMGKHVQNEWH